MKCVPIYIMNREGCNILLQNVVSFFLLNLRITKKPSVYTLSFLFPRAISQSHAYMTLTNTARGAVCQWHTLNANGNTDLPRKSNTPQLCCVANSMLRSLLPGL